MIDLFCGSFGWSAGFLAEGYRSVGFDISHEPYHGPVPEGAELVLQDVLTIHGSQFRNAAIITASPPCQKYSYLAMPWSRSPDPNNSKAAKALRKEWETNGPDNRLFDACFRIQREAIEATKSPCPYGLCPLCRGTGFITRYIPLIVENVRGAQPWVGRSAWNYGSFHLWGDVPALMPFSMRSSIKCGGRGMKEALEKGTAADDFFNTPHELRGQKTQGGSWFRERNGEPQPGIRHENRGVSGGGPGSWFARDESGLTKRDRMATGVGVTDGDGAKIGGDWFSDPKSTCREHGSRSQARKAASAQIAKIPRPLSQYLAQVFKPRKEAAA